jgi:tetratricopeptide (TPR) repeat protein
VRLKRQDEALDEFRRATEIEPGRARYAYVYAVALNSKGRVSDAIAVLEGSLARDPNDRDTLLALVSFSRDAGNIVAALGYAERLARLAPNDRDLANMIQDLRRRAGASQ